MIAHVNVLSCWRCLAQQLKFIHLNMCGHATGIGLYLSSHRTHEHTLFTQLGMCNPCTCNGNVDPSLGPVCDADTGSCLNCINNTTGPTCGECLNGFYGDPFIGDCRRKCRTLPCTLASPSPPPRGIAKGGCIIICTYIPASLL